MHARALAALSVLAFFAIGGGPPPACAPAVVSVTPADGALIETASFEIQVEVTPSLVDATTLEILINGVPQGHLGGPSVYTKPRRAGPPLRDENELEVRIRTRGGSQISRRHTFYYLPPKARARRIESEADRIAGPVGQSRLGDWLLANDVARFAIQDAPHRDLHSVGQYGGNLIDAELVGRPGRDSFFEIQPSTNIESVLNAQSVEIVNDGQDGRAAVLRTCGPDDLIDYINASSQVAALGVTLPSSIDDQDFPVEGCTEYRLRPGESFVEITTTLHNLSGADLGLYVGDYLNGMGALEQWTPPGFGVGELLVGRADAQSYFGFGDAEGVDYALVPVPVPGVEPPSTSPRRSRPRASPSSSRATRSPSCWRWARTPSRPSWSPPTGAAPSRACSAWATGAPPRTPWRS